MLLFTRLTRSLNPNDYSNNRRINGADQADREKISLCGEKIAQKIAKKLKIFEEFVTKKQIELDKQEMMNCLCIKRGIP